MSPRHLNPTTADQPTIQHRPKHAEPTTEMPFWRPAPPVPQAPEVVGFWRRLWMALTGSGPAWRD